jgi:DNA-binding CsgD family transcriptional regulator
MCGKPGFCDSARSVNSWVGMLHTDRLPPTFQSRANELLFTVLENTETGVVVLDAAARAVFMNASARSLLQSEVGQLPPWTDEHLSPMLEHVRATGGQVVERWANAELVLRVRARPLDRTAGLTVLEITVAHAAGSRQIVELLARSLQLSLSDARLLSLLWRGMSNEEIAQTLNVRVGTVKSRLFRLYQKLGVKRRPAAVLRAAEILAA